MPKVRVYELAKELGVESKTVLTMLKDMGEFVRSASSTVEAPVERRLKEKLSGDPAPVKKPAARQPGPGPRPSHSPFASAPAATTPAPAPAQAPVPARSRRCFCCGSGCCTVSYGPGARTASHAGSGDPACCRSGSPAARTPASAPRPGSVPRAPGQTPPRRRVLPSRRPAPRPARPRHRRLGLGPDRPVDCRTTVRHRGTVVPVALRVPVTTRSRPPRAWARLVRRAPLRRARRLRRVPVRVDLVRRPAPARPLPVVVRVCPACRGRTRP